MRKEYENLSKGERNHIAYILSDYEKHHGKDEEATKDEVNYDTKGRIDPLGNRVNEIYNNSIINSIKKNSYN